MDAQSRSGAFTEGYSGGSPYSGYSPSTPTPLAQYQAQYNSMVPKTFQPNGTNMQIAASANGRSPADAERMTIGGSAIPTSNGMSKSTYTAKRPFMSPDLSVG
jgi:hypothetical protein